MRLSIAFIVSIFFFIFVQTAEAKTLPQAAKTSSKTAVKTVSSGINVTPRLRADRKALIVYFSNLQNTKSVSYSLTYNTNTQPEGAIGSLSLGKPSASQELLFGTCSKNVCRYHTGINNMRLEVSYTTNAGKKYLKRYKIKV
ncbi:MAG: hypothetical protein Q7R49_01245 [Candidatus Daviesbacteria bacterium]|nr:hypothetical protein [Candidatus Daviesbacteria bacterium]